jgi:hypothetical protein
MSSATAAAASNGAKKNGKKSASEHRFHDSTEGRRTALLKYGQLILGE